MCKNVFLQLLKAGPTSTIKFATLCYVTKLHLKGAIYFVNLISQQQLTFWTCWTTKSGITFTNIWFNTFSVIAMLRTYRNTTCTIWTSSITFAADLHRSPFGNHLKKKVNIILRISSLTFFFFWGNIKKNSYTFQTWPSFLEFLFLGHWKLPFQEFCSHSVKVESSIKWVISPLFSIVQ